MSNELTALQLLQFIRTIDKLAKEDVCIAFQEWFDNPLNDSVELYICNEHSREQWNDEIEEYLESLGFTINIDYNTSFSGTKMIVTISVNTDNNSSTNTSLLKEMQKLSKESIPTVYEHHINKVTEQMRHAAAKALNYVICPSVPDKVVDHFKSQGFTVTHSEFDNVKFEW